ncbi:putative glycerol kinase 5 isoform X2 [Palaemon carinicauda]|uniref:putative glycerol kinase 5 isoform X2 n=1 Tax=Palaemon carinicauda TaxID=392227 RepID=UPI0035B5AB3F
MGRPESFRENVETSSPQTGRYIASLDLGTTTIRCFIYNERVEVCGKAEEKVTLLYPSSGQVEIDPDELWGKSLQVIHGAITDASIKSKDIHCLGITTQRATFLTWNRQTGEPFHNFITWKDIRADNLVKDWNESWTLKGLRWSCSLLYGVLREKRYLAASVLRFFNIQVNLRLKWILENNETVKEHLSKTNVMFGTIDTWLIYKLSGGKVHATDYSNASGTAIYDPFIQNWSNILTTMLNIPKHILPDLRNSIGEWCICSQELFGSPIPVTAVVSDQGASLFGMCRFRKGDVKITLGTGSFLNVNTGNEAHASINGLYDNPAETSDLASSVQSSNNVYFIPAFKGLQAPVNDARAVSGFLGLSEETTRAHMVRAMLESLAFRVYQMYRTLHEEADYEFSSVRVDGGVSQNDFMMQMIATLTGKTVERPIDTEASALGCAFLAGIGAGIASQLCILSYYSILKLLSGFLTVSAELQ